MAINPLSVQPPQPNIPFLSPSGVVSREWLYYLLTLLNRTGGVLGVSSSDLKTEIVSVGILDSMGDVADPAPPPGFAFDTVLGDEPQSQPTVLPMLLALALGDPEPRNSLNPVLASLLVSDAT